MSHTTLHNRAIIRLSPTESGENVRTFLQGLVTQDTNLVQDNAPVWTALLTPQGKVLFDFLLWADGDDVLVDCEAEQADALAKRLSLYRLRRKIAIARDDSLFVGWGDTPLAAVQKATDPRLDALGTRYLVGEAGGDNKEEWRAHRLALGVAEGVTELGQDKILWLECNAAELNGVSFTKGCYVGQENTARMNWRQKVNRRLFVLPIGAAEEKRLMVSYPDLELGVYHMRVEDVANDRWPAWLVASE